MRTLRMNGVLSALAATVVLTVPLLGSVTAAQAAPSTSRGQRAQAVRMAKDYLTAQAFSFKGLISQLKYEGFSTTTATYGASNCGANWFKQAARMAKDYLRSQPFSRSGLIAQLRYEKFTYAQALYGARAAGL